jgi:hypothetical protein
VASSNDHVVVAVLVVAVVVVVVVGVIVVLMSTLNVAAGLATVRRCAQRNALYNMPQCLCILPVSAPLQL